MEMIGGGIPNTHIFKFLNFQLSVPTCIFFIFLKWKFQIHSSSKIQFQGYILYDTLDWRSEIMLYNNDLKMTDRSTKWYSRPCHWNGSMKKDCNRSPGSCFGSKGSQFPVPSSQFHSSSSTTTKSKFRCKVPVRIATTERTLKWARGTRRTEHHSLEPSKANPSHSQTF